MNFNLTSYREKDEESTFDAASTTYRNQKILSSQKIKEMCPAEFEVNEEGSVFKENNNNLLGEYNKIHKKNNTYHKKTVVNCIDTPPSLLNVNNTSVGDKTDKLGHYRQIFDCLKTNIKHIKEGILGMDEENLKFNRNSSREKGKFFEKKNSSHDKESYNCFSKTKDTLKTNHVVSPKKNEKVASLSPIRLTKQPKIDIKNFKEYKKIRNEMVNFYKQICKYDEENERKSRPKSKTTVDKHDQHDKYNSNISQKKLKKSKSRSKLKVLKNRNNKLYDNENCDVNCQERNTNSIIDYDNCILSEIKNSFIHQIDDQLLINPTQILKSKSQPHRLNNINKSKDYSFSYNSNNLFNVQSNAFIKYCNTPSIRSSYNSFSSNVSNNYNHWKMSIGGVSSNIVPNRKFEMGFTPLITESFEIENENIPLEIIKTEEDVIQETSESLVKVK